MGLFNFKNSKKDKKKDKENSSNQENKQEIKSKDVEIYDPEEHLDSPFKKQLQEEKNSILGKGKNQFITKEELKKQLEEYYKYNERANNNPFKTREDCFVAFWDYSCREQFRLPFEEVLIGNKKLILNKTFEQGRIKINYLFYLPDSEINLKEESINEQSTRDRLDRINAWLNHIKTKRSQGDKRYDYVDTKDLLLQKINLEKTLETIKYGSQAVFKFDIGTKTCYVVRKVNDTYEWVKITEHNFMVAEHASRVTASQEIMDKTDQVLNHRNERQYKGILVGFGIALLLFVFLAGGWNVITFDERLLDKRVEEAVALQIKPYEEQIDYYRNILERNNLLPNNPNSNSSTPDFATPE